MIQLLDADGESDYSNFTTTHGPDRRGNSLIVVSRQSNLHFSKGMTRTQDHAAQFHYLTLPATFIFASMIQARLAQQLEGKLRPNQHGFRPQRGTRHPVFTLGRAMEWSVMTNKKLMLLFLDWKQLFFLDWKQAFESLDHTAMLEALHRFGLSDRMMRSSKSFHESPTFEVQGFDHTAAGKVSAGIRKGPR